MRPEERGKKVRIVLDTNVLVSALNFSGNQRKVFDLFLKGEIQVCVSPFILEELKYVLEKKFKWDKMSSQKVARKIKSKAILIKPQKKISIIKRDEADNRILECAQEGKAHFIISSDAQHLLPLKIYRGIRILRALEFLKLM